MNNTIQQLYQTAAKQEKLIIGLMSGTSLDGLDIALCKVSGSGDSTQLQLAAFKTVSYPEKLQDKLAPIVSVEHVSLKQVCLMHTWLGDYHADLIMEALREWNIEPAQIDCIASHGQTIYHAPKIFHNRPEMPNATLQIIDGDHIARKTGILTISDFRQKHTAAGGQGAPLVALTDKLLFSSASESRILLNIGGIANFTFLPSQNNKKNTLTTDVGPGNTLINQLMQQLFNQPFDRDGEIAAKGTVHPALLHQLLSDSFFSQPLPRTTGPELFNLRWLEVKQQQADAMEISAENLVATVTWFSAQTIADTIKEVAGEDDVEIYLSGGGMHNRQLISWIEELLDQPLHSFMEIGFDPDAKEAASFAVLANETLSGDGFIINPHQSAGRRVNLGKISLPV